MTTPEQTEPTLATKIQKLAELMTTPALSEHENLLVHALVSHSKNGQQPEALTDLQTKQIERFYRMKCA